MLNESLIILILYPSMSIRLALTSALPDYPVLI